jgi:hypothetical protein
MLSDVAISTRVVRRSPPTRKIHDVIYVYYNAIHAALTAASLACPGLKVQIT